MTARPFRIQLRRTSSGRTYLVLSLLNVALTCTTALFIALWARMDELAPRAQWWVKYVLVQGHLATENVVAAWYSSMLLLIVALLALAAFAADGKHRGGVFRYGWLLLAATFAVLSLDEIGSFHERIGMVPSLSRSDEAVGWVYVLALPILVVGLFVTGFGWVHLRRVPRALGLVMAAVALFLMNPVLELIEMALIHGEGAVPGTWQRHLHDILLVMEEGGLELFGILLFVAAIAAYLQESADGTVEVAASLPGRLWTSRAVILLLCTGAVLAPAVVARLPRGDTGIPENWFPAAAWLFVALLAHRHSRSLAVLATVVSAIFGAGLYGYLDWMTSSASWQVPVPGTLAAGLTLEALIRWDYSLMRSPTSSIVSPTLRRPRPNPS